MAFKLLLAVALAALVVAEEYYPQPTYGRPSYGGGPSYGEGPSYGGGPSYGKGPSYGGYDYYGPDNAKYYYTVSQYDPYAYKHANLYFDRYPGGAAYQFKEHGQGSYVDVNVETYRGGYNQKY